jgi:hypothetical protein
MYLYIATYLNLMCCIPLCIETRIFYVAVYTTTIPIFLEDYKFLSNEIHTLHISAYD